MNMSDLLELGAKVFQKSDLSGEAGTNLDFSSLISALGGLSGSGGGFNLSGLLNNLNSGGLGDLVNTWLGDGANASISPQQISDVLGQGNIADFAAKLGLSEQEAAGGLSEALPQMVDKASSGGSLFDSFGGLDGAIDLAGKLFK